ncbi:MAG: hypothetical protein O7G84_01200 [Gammaproteobacteria bacterium]|nr:hypothetical protein [Gammaproteobacteria bacterium]
MRWNGDGLELDRGLGRSPAAFDNIWDGGATLSCWVLLDSFGVSEGPRLLSKTGALASNDAGWVVSLIDAGGGFALQYGFSGDDGGWWPNAQALTIDVWMHLVLTYNADSASNNPIFYVDGVAETTTEFGTPTGTRESDADSNMLIGNFDGDAQRCVDGQIEDLRLYNRILPPSEILDLFTLNGGDGIVDGRIFHLPLDGIVGHAGASEFASGTLDEVSSSTTLTMNVPTGTVEGDKLIIVIASGGNGSTPENMTTPSGWTLVNSGNTDLPSSTNTSSVWVFERDAPASVPATYVVTGDLTTDKTGTMIRAPRVGALDVSSSINTGTSSSPVASSITAGGDAYCLRICVMDGDVLPTYDVDMIPEGVNRRATAAGSDVLLAVADEMVSSGSTGTATFAPTGSDEWGCLTITFDAPSGDEPGELRDIGPNGLHLDFSGTAPVAETELEQIS